MSIANESVAIGRAPLGVRREIVERWELLPTRVQTVIKVALLFTAVLIAFHYSLSSLLQTVGYDSPLAYVGLVPVIATGLAWLYRVPRKPEPPIHDRQLDYILGVPLSVAPLVVSLVVPGRMGAMYWVNRVDLLLLPLFVAGATILVFGTRAAWRQKLAIGYLFLAWPWPYTHVLLGTLGGFTSLTLSGLKAALRVIPVAQPVPGASNEGLFQVMHHGHSFPVSVVTACSGVDGMVGFFLVGAAFAGTVAGYWVRKTLWLAVGLVLLWCTNLARLIFIFWIGGQAGEHLAINILHPVAGLAIFCVGVVLMMLLLRPFGLRLVDARGGRQGAWPTRPLVPGAPKVFVALSIVAVAAAWLGVQNTTLQVFDPVASASGEPKLGSFLAQPAAPAGWTASWETEYTTNKPLFGQSSRWFRYLFTPTGRQSDLFSSLPVTVDVINAAGLSGFDQYGVSACYSFHGYELRDVAHVDLGDGISGQTLSYAGRSGVQDWSIVYWIWPVETATGTRYERIIMYLQNTELGKVQVRTAVRGINGLKGALEQSNAQERRLIVNRTFLVQFAREVIQGQTQKTDRTIDISTVIPPGVSQSELNPTVSANAATIFRGLGLSVRAATGDIPNPNTGKTVWQRLHIHPPPVPARR